MEKRVDVCMCVCVCRYLFRVYLVEKMGDVCICSVQVSVPGPLSGGEGKAAGAAEEAGRPNELARTGRKTDHLGRRYG